MISKINITSNLVNKSISIEHDNVLPFTNGIYFYFYDGNENCKFDNLSFSYTLNKGGSQVATKSWPADGIKFESSTSQYLVSDRLIFEPETEYELVISVTNAGETFNKTDTFTIGRPEQPFASWTWDASSKEWTPPKAKPTDENFTWTWSEADSDWIKREMCVYPNPGTSTPTTKPVELTRDEFMAKLSTMTVDSQNLLTKAETAFTNGDLDEQARIKWQYGTSFARVDAQVILWGDNLSLTSDQLDTIFGVTYNANTSPNP